MSENTVLEGLALRRAVAEAQGWRMVWDQSVVYGVLLDWDEWDLYAPGDVLVGVYPAKNYPNIDSAWDKACEVSPGILAYDTDLNTLKDAAAMLTGGYKFSLAWHSSGTWSASIVEVGTGFEGISIVVMHTEPATAAWNAILRWKAREQEAGSVK